MDNDRGRQTPPASPWPGSPTVTPRGRRRLLQKPRRVRWKNKSCTHSRMFLLLDIFAWKPGACGGSSQHRWVGAYRQSAGLIFSPALVETGPSTKWRPTSAATHAQIRPPREERGVAELIGAKFESRSGRGVHTPEYNQSINIQIFSIDKCVLCLLDNHLLMSNTFQSSVN